ncbi:MAG: shikimate kinase [Ferruginibacter sp.]
MRIFLTGFMGSGKTHWGRVWADTYKYDFYDLDEQIEKREQRTIAEIFDQNGEDIFRLLEAKMLRDMARYEHCIISCGGGTPCFHENMEWMNEKGFTVYLSASPGFLFENIEKGKQTRPLINVVNKAELLFFTEQKLKERLPYYQMAKSTLSAEEITKESFEKILADLPAS